MYKLYYYLKEKDFKGMLSCLRCGVCVCTAEGTGGHWWCVCWVVDAFVDLQQIQVYGK